MYGRYFYIPAVFRVGHSPGIVPKVPVSEQEPLLVEEDFDCCLNHVVIIKSTTLQPKYKSSIKGKK